MVRAILTCGLGLSIVGLALFAIGLFGWLTVWGITATLVVLFAAGCAAWRLSPFTTKFWRARVLALVHCWNVPLLVVYLALLAVGSRAVIPDAVGYSDAIYYHLAYAQDWANAGRIVVDPYLFFPFYANNFVLLYAAWIVLGAGVVVQFMTWVTGAMVGLAIYAAIADYASTLDGVRGWLVIPVGLLLVFALIGTPLFLDYAVLGYIDVPIGAMALCVVLAILLGIRERRAGWLVSAAVMAGFLVGMKASYILILPVFAIAIGWGCLYLGMKRSVIAWILVLLCVISAPWYVRNLVLAGDPIAPTMNLALHGQDGLWDASEWQGLWEDMATSKTPRAFMTLPARAYFKPASADFREYGASGLILFLFVPTLVALVLLAMRRRLDIALAIPIFVLTMFIVYWFVASSLLRYALLFYPILAIVFGFMLLKALQRWPRFWPVALVLALVAAVPSFTDTTSATEFARNDVLNDFHDLLHYPGDRQYLEQNDDGYTEEQAAVDWMHQHRYEGRVYVISDNAFDYYFRREGITSIGTWIGPAGYFRLFQAIDAGEAPEFLNDLGVHAVLVSPQEMIDSAVEYVLAEQLRKAGYKEIPLNAKDGYHLYVRE